MRRASPSAAAVTPPPVAAGNASPYCNHTFGCRRAGRDAQHRGGCVWRRLPWLGCGYTPAQIRAAYGLDKVNYDGKGVTVAIMDAYASPTLVTDLSQLFGQQRLAEDQGRREFLADHSRWASTASRLPRAAAPTAGGKSSRSTCRRCTAARRAPTSCTSGSRDCVDLARHRLHEHGVQPCRRCGHRQLGQQRRGDRSRRTAELTTRP